MKNEKIKRYWGKFIEEHVELFKSNNDKWYDNLNKIKQYIKDNNEIPNQHSVMKEVKKLGRWLSNQKQNYKKEKCIMKDLDIKNTWNEFLEEYKDFF